MTEPTIKMVKPDAKGRVTLGHLADGISRFAISQDEHHRIILEPYVEIPAAEQWLFENDNAMKQVQQGLKDAAQGKVLDRGSFAEYANSEKP